MSASLFFLVLKVELLMRRLLATVFVALLCLQSGGSAYAASITDIPALRLTIPRALGITIAQNWIASHAVVMALIQTRSQVQSSAPDFSRMKRATPLDPNLMRTAPRIRPVFTGAGTRVQGPPMLRRPLTPQESKRMALPTRPMSLERPVRIETRAIRTQSVTLGSPNRTGINHWWTYEESAIPGIGKSMVNVANGNLIVQSDDVDIPERGIDLAFRRTYNSLSTRNWNASGASDDGSLTPGTYG
ncbi:MAG: DUF6531 domain-containing protein, partial [Candidatus Eremiobacteraeota bacterium]|nr:DUF6531 domain-containing protein [Candidatus Eremiobacteraeota bacterium]